jgi:hypothetical protein
MPHRPLALSVALATLVLLSGCDESELTRSRAKRLALEHWQSTAIWLPANGHVALSTRNKDATVDEVLGQPMHCLDALVEAGLVEEITGCEFGRLMINLTNPNWVESEFGVVCAAPLTAEGVALTEQDYPVRRGRALMSAVRGDDGSLGPPTRTGPVDLELHRIPYQKPEIEVVGVQESGTHATIVYTYRTAPNRFGETLQQHGCELLFREGKGQALARLSDRGWVIGDARGR